MKAVVNLWLRSLVILLLFLAGAGGNAVRAQNVPGCDPFGKTPVVDFHLTYDPATNRYTAWYVPTDNTLHRVITGQFTIIAPNGFTTPGSNGRDANFQITNINGSWTDFVLDNEMITSAGLSSLSGLNGLAVHQVGKAPSDSDTDPDGTGPQTSATPVTPGVPVPLFSFPGKACVSQLRILVNDEPLQNQIHSVLGANVNNEITIQIPRAAFVPALQRYCKNTTSQPTIVLPDIQDDVLSVCATSTSYTNNYFTQVLRNWNPANLPAGTSVVPATAQQWSGFTVTPAALQSNVSIDPTSGAYTITFPTAGGVTQPGSVTICNTLRDTCSATDQACVIVSWLSSGQVSIANNPTVCLSNGTALVSLTATSGFSSYNWTGPGLTTSTGNPVTATLSAAGVYSYTVVATNGQSCTATNTTSVTVLNAAGIASIAPTNPTSCSGTDGSATLNGLVAGQSYSITYTRNGDNPVTQTYMATGTGQIVISNLSAGVYSFSASNGACTSSPVSATLNDPTQPASPTLTAGPATTLCQGSSLTLTATGVAGATFAWTGSNLSQTTGNPVTATPTGSGSFVYTVTQTVGGCASAPASTTVTVNPVPMVTPTTTSVTACAGSSFSLSATPSGGTPGYTYTWTGPNFSTTTTTNPVTVSNALLTQSGSYTVSVTDANQCSAVASTAVSVSISNCCSLTVTPTASQTAVCAGTPVVLSANILGAVGTPSFQWSPNASPATTQTVTVTPTATTTYTVVVTDSGAPNCVRTAMLTVVVNPTPVVAIQPLATTLCAGNTIQLTANTTTGTAPPYTYSWSGPNFATTTTVNTVSITNATVANGGSYSVVITDQNSCTALGVTTVPITVTPLPTFSLAPSNPTSCSGTNGSVAINGLTSGQLYTVSYSQNGETAVSSSQLASAGQILLGSLPSGVYSVMVSQNGCSSGPQSVTLTDPVSPVSPNITAQPSATICLGRTITLSATGTNLQWTGMNLLPVTGSPVTASPATSGTFVYWVTQTVAGCTSLPASITVVVNPNPTITNLTAAPACVGQQLTLSATISGGTGQTTVSWLTPDGLTLSGNPLNRPNAQVSMAGSYTLIASDASGCSATQVVSTTVGVAPSVQVQPQQSCVGGNVTLSATGGATSYVWTGPNGFTATGQVITLTGVDASDAGSYSVVVTGGNACTGTATGVVSVNPSPVVKADFLSTSVCVGATLNLLGDITTGTVPPYTFSWTGPNGFASTSQNPSILSAQASNSGSYTFVLTDQNGCSVTATTPASVTVAECCPPRTAQISITAVDPSCGGNTGSATATLLPAAPAGAVVSYQWRNAVTNAIVGTTASVTGLVAGVYSITITETVGSCVQSFTSTASISETPGPDVSLTNVGGANCGAANGSAQLSISGGVTPYTISWSGASSGATTASTSTVQITGLMAGNYVFTVMGQGSTCRGFQNVSIPLLPTSLSLTATATQPVTCGTSGTVVVTWNSVGGPYQLTIDGAVTPVTGTSQTLILGAGTHSIQIASGNPLCVSDSKVILINPVPAPTVAGWSIQQQPVCAGQTGTISFAGGQSSTTQYTLAYLNGGLIGTTAGNINRTYSVGAGIYEITRIEPNGCMSSQTLEISAPPTISFNVQPTDGSCGNPGSLVVTNITGGTPGYAIQYSGPVSGSGTQGAVISGLPAGVYTVTVTDSKGCSVSRTVTIAVASGLNVIATVSSPTACVGGSFVLTANVTPLGSYTYTWSGPNGFVASGNVVTVTSASLTNSGSYTVVVTSAGGCSTTQVTTSAITVSVCQPPCALGLNVVSTASHCNQSDGQVTVSVSGGSGNYAYRWNTGATMPTLTGLASGVYSVTVTDAINSSCYSTTLVAVGNEGGPELSIASITPAACAGATGTATVAVTGGNGVITATWSNGSSGLELNGGQIGTGVPAGVYSVTVVDQTGCSDVALVTIPSTPGTLTATAGGTSAACNQATGTATVTPTGGSGTYSYRWSTGALTRSISGLTAGVYSVTVTDANQCSVTETVSIDNASGPQFTINKTNITCSGGSNGTAAVNVTNAIGPVSYLWNTGAVTSTISGLTAGVYSVVVTDGNGCKASDLVTITQPSPILAELSPSTIACGTTTGTITLKSIQGGTPNYAYQWSNGATSPIVTGVEAGTYTLTITDANGCVAKGVATLSSSTTCPPCVKPTLSVTGPVCNTATGTYTVSYLVSLGASVTVSSGSINVDTQVITVSQGQSVTVLARTSCGAQTTTTVIAPVCPGPACTALAGLSVGQAVCVNGTSYVASVTANAGAVITANGVPVTNGVITGVVGMNVTVVASTACHTQQVVISSPVSCTGNPCENPLVSIAGPVCDGNNTTYRVKYTAPAGVSVTASAGSVNDVTQTITGIPLGVAISVSATNGSCPVQIVPVNTPTCRPCVKPALTVSGPVCNTATNTYSVSFTSDVSSVTASSGSVNTTTKVISGIPTGTNVIIMAMSSCGEVTSTTVVAPVCPGPACTALAGLSVGQAVCVNGTSYVASVMANAGATITANGVPVTNGVITGVVGTNVTVVASTACHTQQVVISSPVSCTGNPCANPLVSVGGSSCEGTSSYRVKYSAQAGVTVTASSGSVDNVSQTITGILSGVAVSITATNGSCTQVITLPAPTECITCRKPILLVGNPVCNGTTYSVFYAVGSTDRSFALVSASVGDVGTNVISNIPIGTPVTVTANWNTCVSTATVESPISCTTSCTLPQLTVGQPLCNGTTYAVSFAVEQGVAVSSNAGNINGNVISNIPVGTNLVVTAGTGNCITRMQVASPTDCSTPCLNSNISLSGPLCRPGGVTFYFNYTVTPGTTVTISQGGSVNEVNGTIEVVAGIYDVAQPTITVQSPGCPPESILLPPASCMYCSKPTLTVGGANCNGTTYSVTFISSTTNVSANEGTLNGNIVSNIPLGRSVIISASGGVDCVTSLTVVSPVCSTTCTPPALTVGQPICNLGPNSSYVVSFAVTAGLSVTSSVGVVDDVNHTITIPFGSSAVVSAVNGTCTTQVVVQSPATCGTPCLNPAISVGGTPCSSNGSTYSVHFVVTNGTTVNPSAGQVNYTTGQITGIPLGVPLSLTAVALPIADFNGPCYDKVILIPSPTTCPECVKPVLTVSGPVCHTATNTYSVTYVSDVNSVTANAGSVNTITKVISGIPMGTNLAVVASTSCGAQTTTTVIAPVCPGPSCTALAGLSVGQAVCVNGTSFIASVMANAGVVITANGVVVSNGIVTGAVGTNTTIVATSSCDSQTLIIASPASCTVNPCVNPLISVAGTNCEYNTNTYRVNYSTPTGVRVIASSGQVNNQTQTITGITQNTPVSLTVTDGSCTQFITINAPLNCYNCQKPVLSVSDPVCNTATNTYSVSYIVSDGARVTANFGSVNEVTKTITGISQGQNLVVTASRYACGAETSLTVPAPNCSLFPCASTPGLTVGQPVCSSDGSYRVSVTTTHPAASFTVSGGNLANGVVTASVGNNVTVTAGVAGCAPQTVVVASPNCSVDRCQNPLISVGGAVCNGTTYSVKYTIQPGVELKVSSGLLNTTTQTITGISGGTPVSITATYASCTQVVGLSSPVSCTTCSSTDGTITVAPVGNWIHNWIAPVPLAMPPRTINCGDLLSYVLTDVAGVILKISTTPTFTGLAAGTYYIYPTTYPAQIGWNVSRLPWIQDHACPWIASAPTIAVICPPVCPAPKPVLTVTGPVCNTALGTYSVGYIVSAGATVSATSGNVSETIHQISGIAQGQPVVITATNLCGEPTSVTVTSPVCPGPACTALAGLSVGQAVCVNGTSYVASVTANAGAVITANGVPVTNGVITGVVGMNVTVVASTACHTQQVVISSPVSCTGNPCENPLVSVGGSSCEGTSSYRVKYTAPAGVMVTSSTGSVNNVTQIISGISSGVAVSITATNGSCTQVITLNAPSNCGSPCSTIAVNATDPTTCTANNGSLTLTGLTAGQSYTVCYSKNGVTPLCQTLSANQNGRIVVSGLGVGLYTGITVSQTGCTSNAVSATLSGGLPAPTASCSVTAVCQGQSITLTASGTNIQWYGPGLLTSTGSPVTAIPNVTGIVMYTAIQSANGCVSPPSTVTVVVKPTPTFSVTATNPTVCNSADGSMTLLGLTPGQSYTVCYTKDAGAPVCAERLANVNGLLTIGGLTASAYTNITVNELGCLSTPKAVTLANPVVPDPVITVAPSRTICLGQAVRLTATGQPGAVYTWKGLGLLGTTGSVVTVNQQATGTFSYTVSQSIAGCGSSQAVTTLTVNPVPSVVVLSKTDPNSCSMPNGTLVLGGLLSNQSYVVCYRVNGLGSPVCLQQSTNGIGNITMNGLTAGVYSVTVSNGGCNSLPVSATLLGQTPAQPNVTVSPSTTLCLGQSVTLTASSSATGTFEWKGPDLASITGGTVTVTPTATGVLTYTVIQTVNGCASIPALVPITVMAIPAPAVVATTAPTTCSGTNGSITLGGLTANQSYTVCYQSSGSAAQCRSFVAGGNGQLVATGLLSGTYSLTVLSAGGCRNAVPVSASVASSTACSVCTDAPLIVAQPMLICKDSTKTVSMQILDGDLSDSFTATACGVGMSSATVTIEVNNATRQLSITYKAAAGFIGIDQVCVTVTDKCGNTDQVYIPVQVIRCVCGCTGTPPVVVPQPIITTKNTPKEVCVPIVDTPTDVHTATFCGGPQNGKAVVTVNNLTHMLCVQYTPNTNFVGTDKVCVTICDQTNRCTVIEVPITVIDIPNPPAVAVVPLVTNCSSMTSAHMPILDANVDNTHSVTVVSQPMNGSITATVDQVNHRILITYFPAPGFTGNDKAVIRVTDSDGLTSENTEVPLLVTPGTCPACVTMELKVLLEGPYKEATHKMATTLNQRGLLPGQTPVGPFGVATPAGQPYHTAPWNYTGTESVTSYAPDVVDWVLVSLRSSELATTPVFRVAGLLHEDGRISFVNPCFSIPDGAYHVVIEHRNHMGVMSPTKVNIVNSKLGFDFTLQNSYIVADPPSFGQITHDGKWMMYGGDGKKETFSDNFDINFSDSKLWKDESGIFDQYRYGDFNMNADVNFEDSVLWKNNNGRYSKVPH